MDLDKYAPQYEALEQECDLIYLLNIEYRIKAMAPYFLPGVALELGTGGGHCTAKLAEHFSALDSVEGLPILADRHRVSLCFCRRLSSPTRRIDTLLRSARAVR